MVFTSSLFLFVFLAMTLLLYYVCPGKLRNFILMACSLFFYAWGEPVHIYLMLLSIAVNYLLGLLTEKWSRLWIRKIILAAAICFNLGMLFYFKYINFFVDTVNALFSSHVLIKQVALPIGISFYTFQIMSYVIDVYRGNVKAQKNICNLALYIAFFPQLIAGPIVRYVDIEEQIRHRTLTLNKFYDGVCRFMIGFSKKVLLADQLAPLVDTAFRMQYSSACLNWVGITAYTLQIYYDFNGYSDMAIGLGKMFGFEFVENFNYPYISQSIKEFWRRWHISLSTWFRDYVYIPMGGSRCTKKRQYWNLIAVFFLTGLWHGASFNFIFWGLYYAAFLVLERMGLGKKVEQLPQCLRHLYALLIILIGWVFFRADTLGQAISYIQGMFTYTQGIWTGLLCNMNRQYVFCLAAGILFAYPHEKLARRLQTIRLWSALRDIGILVIFLVAICYMVGTGFSPFLYFRF